jgi:hypothetical protein
VPGMGSIMCLMIRAFMLALKNRMLFDQSVYLINTTTLVLIDFYIICCNVTIQIKVRDATQIEDLLMKLYSHKQQPSQLTHQATIIPRAWVHRCC